MYLLWMRESKCPLELPVKSEIEYVLSADGSNALINVSDEKNRTVWRVPISRLSWALSMFPVSLKRLPAVESDNSKQIRKLKRQFKNKMPFLIPSQRDEFVRELEGLESMSKVDTSAPRYMLIKYQDGRETPVHRLYLDAGPHDEVDCVDGDFLNFTSAKVKITIAPVVNSGFAIAKGNTRPEVYEQEVSVPGLPDY